MHPESYVLQGSAAVTPRLVMTALHRATVAVLLALSGTFAGAEAQESQDVHTRNDCRLAAQVIRTGHPAPHAEWAYGAIQQCDETGVAVLIEKWRTVSDSLESGYLARASSRFPKRVVFDAISEVVLSSTASTEARLAGMSLLATFAEPNVFLSRSDLRRPTEGRRPRMMSVSGDRRDSPGELGSIAPEVIAIMERLRDTSEDAAISRIAGEYARFLRNVNPDPAIRGWP
jgi:hypothetical protein